MRILRDVADALAATLVVVACESLAVAFLFHRQLVGEWEMRQALRILMPIGWAMSVPFAVLGAVLVALTRRSPRSPSSRGLLDGIAGIFGVFAGIGVTGGRHFESLALRVPFIALLAATAVVMAHFAAPRIGSRMARSPMSVGIGAAVAITSLSIANGTILTRLYPGFHLALAVLTIALAPFLSLIWATEESSSSTTAARIYSAALLLLATLAIVFAPALSQRLVRADNLRFLYGDKAPLLRYAVLAVAEMSPETEVVADSKTTPRAGEAHAIDLRGRDIVVISVDALRADHVGSYGYTRPITPRLDALAKTGVRFENAYCATPHTSYSVTSMMTGKYMRPLLLQGAGNDSDTLAKLLRTYGYRTAGFYPPAVFFIDGERFGAFRERGLDFEYRRVEFTTAQRRAEQVEQYLAKVRPDRRALLWVHLFEPHEPYERHDEHSFGDRDIDRYDGEIAAADGGIGAIVDVVRKGRPDAAIVITADHGEEFGEHGGRYHGTSVYEEQVRVPLVIVAPGIIPPRVVTEPVQTIDLLPTILSSLRVPRPARVRGRDLTELLATKEPPAADGFAFSETDEMTLLAEGPFRLVCARRLGACQLYDVAKDPLERRDVSAMESVRFETMRKRLREVESAHGRYELEGLRAEGKAWPEPIRRGIAGDGDAAIDVAALLDDADATYREKAAEVLFELAWRGDDAGSAERISAAAPAAAALRLALTRDENDTVRKWAALTLTRLGEGAGMSLELIDDKDSSWRRLAALALAETGDSRGDGTLVGWWLSGEAAFERSRQIIAALGKIRSKRALVPLLHSLGDLRLRPYLARALAKIGESAARPALLDAFAAERYVPTRHAIGEALVSLGAGAEMAPPLARFLGTPDPLPDGLALARKGGFLPSVGGPDDKDLRRLTKGRAGVMRISVIVPRGGRGDGFRLLVRGRSLGTSPAPLRVGIPVLSMSRDEDAPAELDARTLVALSLPVSQSLEDVVVTLPPTFGAKAGSGMTLAIDRPDGAEIAALAVVPLADELPPPSPEPWTPTKADQTEDIVDDGT